MVLDGSVLNQLYLQRDRAEKKKQATREARMQNMSQPVSRQKKGKATPQRNIHFEVSEEFTIAEVLPDDSGYEMEDCETDLEALLVPDSSGESIMVAN